MSEMWRTRQCPRALYGHQRRPTKANPSFSLGQSSHWVHRRSYRTTRHTCALSNSGPVTDAFRNCFRVPLLHPWSSKAAIRKHVTVFQIVITDQLL
jgi:hypothetical protein